MFRLALLVAVLVVTAAPAAAQAPAPNDPPARASEPIVLKGSEFGSWSAPANQTAKIPLTDVFECGKVSGRDDCQHNHYATPEVDTGDKLGRGTPVGQLAGFRWDAGRGRFVQIPFQVDEVFTRYLDNSASGFAAYSGQDQHTTYAYDREGWRYTESDPKNPCVAVPKDGVKTTPDPVPGLDNNDEVAFMASDAGPRAPQGTPAPAGAEDIQEVAVGDAYVYVAKGVRPAFNASNGYVHYRRDPVSETFEKSESSYSDYGNAAKGTYCDANGNVVVDPKSGQPDIQRRRPRDYATVTTGRYSFRYDGRWLMDALSISPDGGHTYGPDLVDRWKARAFAQDPSSETPCCGFEEEDTHWGGSSTLLGELTGPVRAVRETWGADSGTNVIRRETFYRDTLQQKSWLRVHPIPPLDGIYAQWDFNGGKVTRFYNSKNEADGVPIDGHNDEAFGNLDDPCNENYSVNDTGPLDQGYRDFYASTPLCDLSKYHQSVDVFDPTFSQANVALEWSQVTGPNGTIVDRYRTEPQDLTPGGAAQSVVATPYYRDDSCFDDGTGTDPGPRVNPGSADEPRAGRKCWHPEDGPPDGTSRFFQGSIATHGVHLLFVAESDNARQQVPIDEIVSIQDMAMIPGQQPGSVGASFGQVFAQPSRVTVGPAATVRDASAPAVRLSVRRDHHGRAALRWRGHDTGGSGIRAYRVQVKAPGMRWRTLRRATRGHSLRYRATRTGRHLFRVRALDRAGNRSRWSQRRIALRSRG
jgi:hypothetical protein